MPPAVRKLGTSALPGPLYRSTMGRKGQEDKSLRRRAREHGGWVRRGASGVVWDDLPGKEPVTLEDGQHLSRGTPYLFTAGDTAP